MARENEKKPTARESEKAPPFRARPSCFPKGREGKLRASLTPEECDAYFIVVPTPFKGDHEPDVSFVEAATRTVSPFLKEGDLFVIESTSPVGTTEAMADVIFALRPELRDKVHIAYCPECGV